MVSFSRYQTKQGMRWAVQWRTPDHRQTKKRGFTRKIDAQRWAARNITTPIAEGAYTSPTLGRTTVSDVWQDLCQTRDGTLKPTTIHVYRSAWDNHLKHTLGPQPILRVTRAQMLHAIMDGTGPAVGLTIKAIIGLTWKHARDMGINTDPSIASDLPVPRAKPREHRYLTMRQLLALSRAAERYGKGTLVLLLGVTGIRWGEATALRTKDIDLRNNLLHIRLNSTRAGGRWHIGTPKNGKTRTIPIPASLARALARATEGKDPDQPVFGSTPNPSAGRRSRGWWPASLRNARLPYMGIHDLRHTAASLAVANGADIKVLQNMLGHSSAALTLDVYADLFEGRDRQVADTMGAALDRAMRDDRPPVGTPVGTKHSKTAKPAKDTKGR